jgi:molybdopterin molybdotransferase
MLSVEAALSRLLAAADGPLPAEEVPLADALGRVLSETVHSAFDLPPWDNSAMDGFAVHAADTTQASPAMPVCLRVVGEVRAGGVPGVEVPPGCAVRIATGAPTPPSVDAVVPVESTICPGDQDGSIGVAPSSSVDRATGFSVDEPLAGSCLIVVPVGPGVNIRRRGDDVRQGMTVLEAGEQLGPAQIALAAAVGLCSVRVRRRPVVGVLSTGDELRGPADDLGRSGIRDANRPGLMAACRAAGAMAADLGIARDTLESVLAALRPALEGVDAIIVSGGVSVGPFDVVRTAFDEVGSVDLWQVAIQPGKPFAFGVSNPRERDGRRVLLFGLPGNPAATLLTFELFVRPVLHRLEGRPATAAADRAITEDCLRASSGRRGFVRVTVARAEDGSVLRDDRGRTRVRLAGGQGSHMLRSMAAADALAIVREDVGRLEPGDEVEIRWLRP